MQHYTVYLYPETALHVSGGTTTHHQESIQLYLQHLVFVTSLLLSAAIAAAITLHLVGYILECGLDTIHIGYLQAVAASYLPLVNIIFTITVEASFVNRKYLRINI
jgi:hypothetical protein